MQNPDKDFQDAKTRMNFPFSKEMLELSSHLQALYEIHEVKYKLSVNIHQALINKATEYYGNQMN